MDYAARIKKLKKEDEDTPFSIFSTSKENFDDLRAVMYDDSELFDGVVYTKEQVDQNVKEYQAVLDKEDDYQAKKRASYQKLQDDYDNMGLFEKIYNAWNKEVFTPIGNTVSDTIDSGKNIISNTVSGGTGIIDGIGSFYSNRYYYLIGFIVLFIFLKKI